MMSRFIALPVGQGDAFYLARGNWSVLVDGGRAQASFGTTFQTTTGVGSVDVLVCTHNDADHANGVIGFLEAGLGCGEIWLPGRWLGALPGILRPFADVFITLARELVGEQVVADNAHLRAGATPLEQLADRLRDGQPASDNMLVTGEDGWPESLRKELEEATPWDSDGWFLPGSATDWRYFRHPYSGHPRIGPSHIRLLWSAIDAARIIRGIAVAAFHRGIPVRWFEYDAYRPRGGHPALQPLNAREIARVQPLKISLLRYLALTASNKESLVFWSPRDDESPGVLFNADSNLDGVRMPNAVAGAIATAPHHGSEANAKAYSTVAGAASDAPSVTWVRSDGRYRSRPGSSYLTVSGHRLCTICRLPGGRSSTKQPVHLFSQRGDWSRHRNTSACTCV